MDKRLFLILFLFFSAFGLQAQEQFYFIEALPISMQNKVIVDLKSKPDFEDYKSQLNTRAYNSYDVMQSSSDIINQAYLQHSLDSYKTKGINFVVDVGQDYMNKVIEKSALGPIMKNSIDFMQTEWTEGELSEDRIKLQKSLEQAFAGYIKDVYENNPNISEAAVSDHINKFIDLRLVKIEDYSIIGKDVDKFLLSYVRNNEERMIEISSVVREQLKNQEDQIEDINGNIADLSEAKNSMKESLIKIEENQQANIIAFNKFQVAVYKEFEGVYSTLDAMGKEIEENANKVEENSRAIVELERKQNKTEQEVAQLSVLQQQNKTMIRENTYKISVISGVLYNNAGTEGKIELIKTGVIELQEPQKEIDRLEVIHKLEEFNQGLRVAGESLTLAKNLGLSQKDAERASKVLEGAGIIAQGVTSYYTGNVLGGLQTVNAIFAFGEGGNPPPDPEFQEIERQLEEIKQQLNIIEQKVDLVNTKLDSLIKWEFGMHERVMSQMETLEAKLITVDSKINYIVTLMTSDCNIVADVNSYNLLMRSLHEAQSLRRYSVIHNSSNFLRKILVCIDDNVSSSDLGRKSFLHYNRIDNENIWQTSIYDPIIRLLQSVYPDQRRQEAFLYSLTHPVIYNSDVNKFASLANNEVWENVNLIDFNIFINPVAVGQLSELFILLEPYYLLGDSDQSFAPYSAEFISQEVEIPIRNEEVSNYFKNLLKICDYSISQQSLISGGPFLSRLHAALLQPGAASIDNNIISDILTSGNYYLKTNLATYILKAELSNNKSFYKKLADLYRETGVNLPSNSLLQEVNSYLNYSNLSLISNGNQSSGYSLMLQVENRADNKKFLLPVSEPEKIFNGELIYPSNIYRLLEIKKALLAKVMEYHYTSQLGNRGDIQKYITNQQILNN